MKKHKGVDVPTTIREWELYSSVKGSGKAARRLTAAVITAINEADERFGSLPVAKLLGDVYKKHVDPVMSEFREFGATDTEPRFHAQQTLVDFGKLKTYGHTREYHPEFADCM